MRHWATPPPPPSKARARVDEHAATGARKLGFTEEALAKLAGGRLPDEDPVETVVEDYELWDENEAMWAFFHACCSQWHYRLEPFGLGMVNRRSGLHYPGCESVARGQGLKWRHVFADLQAMEFEVLAVAREGAEANNNK